MGGTLGERFVEALASKDDTRLRALVDPYVEFRGMTPNRFWEATGVDELLSVLGQWFDEKDDIEDVEDLETGEFVDRERIEYRFRVRNGEGLHLVEQQGYLIASDGRITWLRVMCSGFRPIADS